MLVTAVPPTQDIKGTQDELERLAINLEYYNDHFAAERLRNLKTALSGQTAAYEDWAATDIQKVINPRMIAEGIKSKATPGWMLRIFEWIRNGLVFVPLTLTWLAIWQAIPLYEDQVNRNKELSQFPFLYLWQQGFGGKLNPFFLLSNVALFDAALLGFIFLLTLFVTWRYSVTNAQREKDAELLCTRLSLILGDASLCIAMLERQRATQQPSNLADIARFLANFSSQFQTATQQLITEMEEERQRRGDLNAFTTRLENMSRDMISAADVMKKSSGEMTVTLKDLLVQASEVPKLVASSDQAVGHLNSVVQGMGQVLADQKTLRQELQNVLATGLRQLTEDQKQANQEMYRLLDAALQQQRIALGQQISDQRVAGAALQSIITTKMGEIVEEHKTLGTNLVAEQRTLGQQLMQTAASLDVSMLQIGTVIKDLEAAARDQSNVLGAMHAQQTHQQQMTDQMSAATGEIGLILKSVREAGPDLQGMAVAIDHFSRALKDIPDRLKTDLLNPLTQYSSAAANVVAGSNTLEKAALHLEYVTNKLDGKLGN